MLVVIFNNYIELLNLVFLDGVRIM